MTLQHLFNKLWEADPGYFRLKQSCKTVIALLIVGLITLPAPLLLKFFAAISAGFSIQAIVANTRKSQIKFILLAFPVYFLCFMLGALSKTNTLFSSSVLVILGFLAIYVKKYGPEFNFAPIIAWSFAFFGIILSTNDQNVWLIFGSVLLGQIVAGLVYLFVFPELKSKLFYSNINKFFKQYAVILQWLAHILIHKTDIKHFQSDREEYKAYLFRLTVLNGDITQNRTGIKNIFATRLYQIYVRQYALAKIASMLMEAFETLIQQKITLADTARSHLFTVFAIYAAAIANMDVSHSKSNYQTVLATLQIMEKNLADFQELILDCLVTKKQPMIALVNLNLGLHLIFNNIKNMGQIYEN